MGKDKKTPPPIVKPENQVQLPEELMNRLLTFLNEFRPKSVIETAVLIQEIQHNTKPVVGPVKENKEDQKG